MLLWYQCFFIWASILFIWLRSAVANRKRLPFDKPFLIEVMTGLAVANRKRLPFYKVSLDLGLGGIDPLLDLFRTRLDYPVPIGVISGLIPAYAGSYVLCMVFGSSSAVAEDYLVKYKSFEYFHLLFLLDNMVGVSLLGE